MDKAIAITAYREVMAEVFAKMVEAFQNLFDEAIDKWDEIKKFIVEGHEKLDERDYIRDSWVVPLRIMRTNQVINRKPVMCRARSYC